MINKISCFGVALLLCLAMLYSCTSDIDSPEDALKRIGEEETAGAGESSSSYDDEISSSSNFYDDSSSSNFEEPCDEEEGCEDSSSSSYEGDSSSSEPCEDDCEESSSSSEDGDSSSSDSEPCEGDDCEVSSSSSEDGESSSSSEEPSSSSTPDPVIGECVLPSFTCVGETIEALSLVAIENNLERCSGVILLGSSSSGSASLAFTANHKGDRNIYVRVNCGDVIAPQTKACRRTFVADRCVEFDHNDDPHNPVQSGTTVIKLTMPWDDRGPNGFGCAGSPPIAFSVTTLNGKINSSNENPDWSWASLAGQLSGYEENGNRILFETSLTNLECTTFYE